MNSEPLSSISLPSDPVPMTDESHSDPAEIKEEPIESSSPPQTELEPATETQPIRLPPLASLLPKEAIVPPTELPLTEGIKNNKRACSNCRKASKKCDRGDPCGRCISYGIGNSCVESTPSNSKRGPKSTKLATPPQSPMKTVPLVPMVSMRQTTPIVPWKPLMMDKSVQAYFPEDTRMVYAEPSNPVPDWDRLEVLSRLCHSVLMNEQDPKLSVNLSFEKEPMENVDGMTHLWNASVLVSHVNPQEPAVEEKKRKLEQEEELSRKVVV